jgi:hypothetical protein
MNHNPQSMQLMDQKIKKFKEFIDEFSIMFQQGHLSYNMWMSQHAELQRINNELIEKNKKSEEIVSKTLEANELIKREGQTAKDKMNADIMVLWTKAHSKFKEVERLLDDAEKKRIREALKGLEAVAA